MEVRWDSWEPALNPTDTQGHSLAEGESGYAWRLVWGGADGGGWPRLEVGAALGA